MVPPELKLYVVGEGSSNPSDWTDGSWCLVFADSTEQAKELAGDWPASPDIAEVVPVEAGVILQNSPPCFSF